MSSTVTLEIRWFKSGRIPDRVQTWFNSNCPGQLIAAPEQRQDKYINSFKGDDVSLKLREGRVELKWRVTDFGIHVFGKLPQDTDSNSGNWEGRVEKWIKWSYPEKISSNLLNSTSKMENKFSWLTVKKKRWQRIYKKLNIEITQLELQGIYWWTFAFEMLGKDPIFNNKQDFIRVKNAVDQVWSQSNLDITLLARESQGYPSWLLHNYYIHC